MAALIGSIHTAKGTSDEVEKAMNDRKQGSREEDFRDYEERDTRDAMIDERHTVTRKTGRELSELVAMMIALFAGSAFALDFRTVSSEAAVLYDAPSARSQKLYVVNRGYPLEVIVTVQGWVESGFGQPPHTEFTTVLTSANRMPAAAFYVRKPGDALYRPIMLDVLRIEDGAVVAVTAFELPGLIAAFGLPDTLTAAPA